MNEKIQIRENLLNLLVSVSPALPEALEVRHSNAPRSNYFLFSFLILKSTTQQINVPEAPLH